MAEWGRSGAQAITAGTMAPTRDNDWVLCAARRDQRSHRGARRVDACVDPGAKRRSQAPAPPTSPDIAPPQPPAAREAEPRNPVEAALAPRSAAALPRPRAVSPYIIPKSDISFITALSIANNSSAGTSNLSNQGHTSRSFVSPEL